MESSTRNHNGRSAYSGSEFCTLRGYLQEFFGDAGLEATRQTGPWMREGEDLGVQGDATDGVAGGAVFFIPDNRMPQILHMHTDLVFPACLEIDLQ